MSKNRYVILLLIVMAFVVCGCGRNGESTRAAGPVDVVFWNGFTGPDGTTMERIVRSFNHDHPNIRVKMQIIPWATYYDKLTLGLAYGGAPDVFILHVNRFPEYAYYNSLNCTDDLVAKGGLDANDFVQVAWKAGLWHGKRYAVPLDCHPIGLYYNVDLFKKAGIVDQNGNALPPVNLAEFLQDAKKLTKDTNGDGRPDQWGFAFTWLRTNSYTFLGQFGTGLLDKDSRRADINSSQAKKAMGLMADLVTKYKVCPSPEGQDAWMGFQTGKVAMAMEGVYMLASLEDQKGLHFAGAVCPMFGKKHAVWAGSHLMVMPRSITSEKRKAAWEFITYLSDHSIEWAKGGQVPVRKSILDSAEFKKLPVQYQFSKELPYVVYEPPVVPYNQIVPFADAAFEAVLMHVKPANDALDECARRVDKVMNRQ